VFAVGQQRVSGMVGSAGDEFESLRTGELTVWQSGIRTYLGWEEIEKALRADFPELRVNFRSMDRPAFLGDLAAARSAGALPDVVFVDNWLQAGPMVAQQQAVEMTNRPRFYPSTGWWFQMSAGAHPATAAAFLRWLADSPHWQAPRMSTAGMTESDTEEVASAALISVAGLAGGGSTDSVMDPDAARFDRVGWPGNCGQISGMTLPVVRFLFGNGRLAYTTVSFDARSSGGTVTCGGFMNTFLMLRKRDDGWKVLLRIPTVSLEQAVSLADQFDRLNLSATAGDAPAVPQLVSPSDGERQTRNPKQAISWGQDARRPALYVVEWRYGMPSGAEDSYSASEIVPVRPGDYGNIVRMPTPFGKGVQPHRWRVWAIGKDGQVALSEWRTVVFTN
jgi:hypothetical protein